MQHTAEPRSAAGHRIDPLDPPALSDDLDDIVAYMQHIGSRARRPVVGGGRNRW